MVRAIGIVCGGWIAVELLAVLVGQMASSAEETATFLSLGLGVGSFGVGYVLQRAIPSMKRTAWWLAAGWSLALIGAIQIGIVAQIDSNALSGAAVGVCGVVSAWAVLRDRPGVPRWQYGVIGAIWLVTYAVGSGYAWYMVSHRIYHGSSLATTMSDENLSVFSLILGAILSAAAGGVAFWQIARALPTSRPQPAVQQPSVPSTSAPALPVEQAALRAIITVCGGWVAIELLDVLVGQLAPSGLDGVAYFRIGYGAGCLMLALVMQRVLPTMKRTAWLLAGGWALVTIGALQIGVAAQLASNWLYVLGNGICGVIGAWAVLHPIQGVRRWQYGVIGLVWLLADAIGSGYAWEIVTHKLYQGWSLASAMDKLNISVLSLVLGPMLSAVAGGVALYLMIDRARKTAGHEPDPNQGSTYDRR